MRALIQRVKKAHVEVSDQIMAAINQGLLVLLGVHITDDASVISHLVDKIIHLRIFSDEQGKMNLSLMDIQGDILVVSQFTLYGDCSSGRRPSFTCSAQSDLALELYQLFIRTLQDRLKETSCRLQTGKFGATMQVSLTNRALSKFIGPTPNCKFLRLG